MLWLIRVHCTRRAKTRAKNATHDASRGDSTTSQTHGISLAGDLVYKGVHGFTIGVQKLLAKGNLTHKVVSQCANGDGL